MDYNSLLLGSGMIFLAGAVGFGIIRIVFKKSIISFIAYTTATCIVLISCTAFFLGLTKIENIFWTGPISIALALGCYYLISTEIKGPLQKLTTSLNKIATGDLSSTQDKETKKLRHELKEMNYSVGCVIEYLQSVVSTVSQTADQLIKSSNTIRNNAQDVSDAANNQASSVEEISTSIEEMTASIQQNAENAKVSEKVASKSASGMIEISKEAKSTMAQMDEIVREVSTIRDIVNQTNILSLNAAVEAARAGEHGRGFSVVAAEVRKLAERSKIAAEKIFEILDDGVEKVKNVGDNLNIIVPKIDDTAHKLSEISTSSFEQKTGVEQINKAIQNLNVSSQNNAQAAERLVFDAENIAKYSQDLNEIVGFFKV